MKIDKTNLVELGVEEGQTALGLDPNLVLNGAIDKLTDCIVIGWDNESMMYFASSSDDFKEDLMLIERAKYRMMDLIERAE